MSAHTPFYHLEFPKIFSGNKNFETNGYLLCQNLAKMMPNRANLNFRAVAILYLPKMLNSECMSETFDKPPPTHTHLQVGPGHSYISPDKSSLALGLMLHPLKTSSANCCGDLSCLSLVAYSSNISHITLQVLEKVP